MISANLSLSASSYRTLFSSGSGALYVPVSPSSVIYTQFDHVRGIAASSGQAGVPISRVKILNTLIDQLVNMKQKPSITKENLQGMNDKQMDALIQKYQKQINISVAQSAKANTYGLAGIMPEAGAVFNINA